MINDYKKTIYVYLWHCARLQQTKTSTQLRVVPYILGFTVQVANSVENLTKSGVPVRKNGLLTLSNCIDNLYVVNRKINVDAVSKVYLHKTTKEI